MSEFVKILTEVRELHNKKSHDYAPDDDRLKNYRIAGATAKLFSDDVDSGLAGRFAEKVQRLLNLEGKNPLNESIEDTELDLIVILTLFVANRRERRTKVD